MLTQKKITEKEFDPIFHIMKEAFPITELRTYEGQKALLLEEDYTLYGFFEKEELIGFSAIWEIEGVVFVEHFAVKQGLRSSGYGAEMLNMIREGHGNDMMLEVEPPITETAKRRIAFYEKQGFYLNGYPYKQPPLRKGNPWIPLMLMSWPSPISRETFENYQKLLYERVYKSYI
jgi:ribosomal protein S18 acetylase RimI-like enzyme